MEYKIDLKDKKIMYELDFNSRQTASQIGRKVGLSKEVVNYRIDNLIKKGIIKYFYTSLNTLTLRYSHYKIYLKLQNVNPTKEKEIINYFIKNKHCVWVGTCRGNWDLGVSLLAKSHLHFGELYSDIVNRYGKYILEKNILIIEKAPTFNRTYLKEKIMPLELEYIAKTQESNLDETDKKILSIISTDARINIISIIDKSNLTREIVSYRLKRMEDKGVIQEFRTSFDLEKLGIFYYKILFTFKNLSMKREKELIDYCRKNKNIVKYIKLIGNWDAEVEFEIQSEIELHDILLNLKKEFSDIIRNSEQLLIYEKKLNYYPF